MPWLGAFPVRRLHTRRLRLAAPPSRGGVAAGRASGAAVALLGGGGRGASGRAGWVAWRGRSREAGADGGRGTVPSGIAVRPRVRIAAHVRRASDAPQLPFPHRCLPRSPTVARPRPRLRGAPDPHPARRRAPQLRDIDPISPERPSLSGPLGTSNAPQFPDPHRRRSFEARLSRDLCPHLRGAPDPHPAPAARNARRSPILLAEAARPAHTPAPFGADVAQVARAGVSYALGRWFDSSHRHRRRRPLRRAADFFVRPAIRAPARAPCARAVPARPRSRAQRRAYSSTSSRTCPRSKGLSRTGRSEASRKRRAWEPKAPPVMKTKRFASAGSCASTAR